MICWTQSEIFLIYSQIFSPLDIEETSAEGRDTGDRTLTGSDSSLVPIKLRCSIWFQCDKESRERFRNERQKGSWLQILGVERHFYYNDLNLPLKQGTDWTQVTSCFKTATGSEYKTSIIYCWSPLAFQAIELEISSFFKLLQVIPSLLLYYFFYFLPNLSNVFIFTTTWTMVRKEFVPH